MRATTAISRLAGRGCGVWSLCRGSFPRRSRPRSRLVRTLRRTTMGRRCRTLHRRQVLVGEAIVRRWTCETSVRFPSRPEIRLRSAFDPILRLADRQLSTQGAGEGEVEGGEGEEEGGRVRGWRGGGGVGGGREGKGRRGGREQQGGRRGGGGKGGADWRKRGRREGGGGGGRGRGSERGGERRGGEEREGEGRRGGGMG